MACDEITALVERTRGGDRAAFGELVEQFQPNVYAMAMARLRNIHEAQEVTQEVFAHVLAKFDQLRDARCFAGWLRRIAVRTAVSRLRKHDPCHLAEHDAMDDMTADTSDPLDDLVHAERCEKLRVGLERLKPLDRETLVAFYVHDQTVQQMSRQFATPAGTIKRRLHIARNRLREQLGETVETEVGGAGGISLPAPSICGDIESFLDSPHLIL